VPWRARFTPTLAAVETSPHPGWLAFVLALLALTLRAAHAEPPLPPPETLAQQVQRFADESTRRVATPAGRIEVEVGTLDPRLRLAPCERIEPYLPTGTRLWGKAHIGLRCVAGPKRWNVYLPITVHVHGRALVATSNLPAGSVLAAADLAEAEVDLAAERGPAFAASQAAGLVGRSLVRGLNAGEALRGNDLKARQWFAAGDVVRITAQGGGFAVSSSGEALSPGIEGRSVRVRTEGGRVVSGEPVGEREVELAL
jgi:flagellar basal body P-ring formation protein FlgA